MKEKNLPYTKPNIDWSEIEKWDRKYYLHNTQAQNEYVFFPVEAVDKNYLYLPDGKKLLDFQSQLVSDNMGHRNQRVHNEIKIAMERYGHIFFGLSSDYRAKAAKLLINDIIGHEKWAGRVRILSSGTEAVENAMSMARLYRGTSTILTQELSYHGLVPGATQLDGYRGNLTKNISLNESLDVPGFPDKRYVNIPAPEYSDFINKSILPSLKETERIINNIGPKNVAGIITETMIGGASYMPHSDYLRGIHNICKKYNILWILDDVLCGFGRLGEWFSYQIEENIFPDLLIIGKGLNGCALPVGAIITSLEVGEFFDKARWWSGSTHDAHPLVCASIVGNIESMMENDIINKSKSNGRYLLEKLLKLKDNHPCIGRISGRGMYYSLDLVDLNGDPIIKDDRKTRFTGNLSNNPNNVFANFCIENGLFAGGFMPNTIKAAPPLTISINEIDFAIDIMDKAFDFIEKKFH
ncbi:MAG: Taurine--pyruvate aminotransferase [Alphaproteobacteria bacterium MarineAlpha2_Bin1]|nr:MAG: Taurine--pyruvate aminotransferase [Alphaproteobacteria bacterium MarineAlpha2_Bin1]